MANRLNMSNNQSNICLYRLYSNIIGQIALNIGRIHHPLDNQR